MGAIIPILMQLFQTVPSMVKAGLDVADLVSGAVKTTKQIGTTVSPTDEEFKALDALAKEYDDDFDAAVAARLA